MADDYSFDALMEFLDYLGSKGLMNRNTVISRKASCNKVFSVLDEEELHDLRTLDLNIVVQRFTNLQGKEYTPKSLRVYKSRVNSTLDDFLRYKENPAAFTISAKPRERRASKPVSENGSSRTTADESVQSSTAASPHVATINVPIALSSGRIVQINGLPIDMSQSDAKKIANVVMAMASKEV